MDNTNLPSANFTQQQLMPIAVLKNLGAYIKIKNFDKVGHIVIPICNKHAVLSGITTEIDSFTKEEIAKYTAIHLKNLTFEEIEIAFQNERFNQYDNKTMHYNFFSIVYFVEIITKYKIWKQNQMTIHNISIAQILPQNNDNPLLEKNKKAVRIEFIKQIFNELKETKKEYINDAFTLYDAFVEHKLIIVTPQQKKDLYAIMVKETIKITKEKLITTHQRHLKKELQNYIEILSNKNNDTIVTNKCKAYLVSKSIDSFQSADAILKKLNL